MDVLSEKISQAVLQDPEQPDLSLSEDLFNTYEGALRRFEEENSYTNLVTSFGTGYNTYRELLRDHLDRQEQK